MVPYCSVLWIPYSLVLDDRRRGHKVGWMGWRAVVGVARKMPEMTLAGCHDGKRELPCPVSTAGRNYHTPYLLKLFSALCDRPKRHVILKIVHHGPSIKIQTSSYKIWKPKDCDSKIFDTRLGSYCDLASSPDRNLFTLQ